MKLLRREDCSAAQYFTRLKDVPEADRRKGLAIGRAAGRIHGNLSFQKFNMRVRPPLQYHDSHQPSLTLFYRCQESLIVCKVTNLSGQLHHDILGNVSRILSKVILERASLTITSLKTIVFTLGPIALPKLISYYRSTRRKSHSPDAPIRPIPRHVTRALNILFITAIVALISTLPYFAPENIFAVTQSRLQIPTDVLFTRLAALRPLTLRDEALKTKLVSLEARLLYFTYGPGPLADCLFCNSDDHNSYFYYSFPSIMTPHLLHIIVLGLITSSLFSGREGKIWRTQATIAGAVLAIVEMYLVTSFDHKSNTRAARLNDINAIHWRLRMYRGIGMAIVDALLGWGLYLSSTNRAFLTPPTPAERLEASARMLESTNRKLHALGITRNVFVRDEGLRATTEKYWTTEGKVMNEVFEEREVVDGVQSALARLDVNQITEEASRYADSVVSGIQAVPGDSVS